MGLMNWLGFGDIPEHRSEIPPEQPPQGSGVIPPARDTRTVTADTALTLSAVYRSVQILGVAGSQLSLDVWRGEDRIEPKPSVVRKPDVNTSLSEFVELTIHSMALYGNAYWRIQRDDRGPRNIEVLNPWECAPQEDGKLGWKGKTLQPDEFRHLKLMRRPGITYGLGPIQSARADIEQAMNLRDYAGEIFNDGSVPSGVLSSDQHLNAEQAAEYKERWDKRPPHSTAVLGAGLTYSPVLLAPEDAQFLQSQQLTHTKIAMLFGIPAHLLLAAVEGSSMTYQNISQADLTFVRWTLMVYLRPIEEAFTSVLPGLQTARFNLDGILRPDIQTRYAAHQIALTSGFATVNEIRAIEGLPPVPGGDALRAPTNPSAPPAENQE